MTVLSAAELAALLPTLPGWSGDPIAISRTYTAPDFSTGIKLVNAVAEVAEDINHHPDIDIRWTKVTFRLTTHSAGGVTRRDIDLAARIAALATTYRAE